VGLAPAVITGWTYQQQAEGVFGGKQRAACRTEEKAGKNYCLEEYSDILHFFTPY